MVPAVEHPVVSGSARATVAAVPEKWARPVLAGRVIKGRRGFRAATAVSGKGDVVGAAHMEISEG